VWLSLQLCYNNKHLQGALIVAGWDIYQGGQVYCLPIGGTLVQEKWAADGSGSLFLMGYMDSVFR
jgi:20S proteasome subunit beta 1